jgi:O-antigen/teichoic acid export membrane protein
MVRLSFPAALRPSHLSFLKDAGKVFMGTSIGQLIMMGTSPVITRIYTPEALGLLGLFNFALSVLGPAAAMSYPMAIVLARGRSDSFYAARLSIILSVALCAITAAALIAFDFFERGAFILPIFWYMLPLAVLLTGLMQVSQQLAVRDARYSAIATVAVVQAVAVSAARIVGGLWRPVGEMLVVISALGPGVAGAFLSIYNLRKSGKASSRLRPLTLSHEAARMRSVGAKFKDLAFLRTPQSILSAVAMGLPVALLGYFDGPGSAGHYSLAVQVLMLPSVLVGTGIANAFFPRFARSRPDHGQRGRMLAGTTAFMAALGIVPHLVLLFGGPLLFSFVFGSAWETAGIYSQLLSIWLFLWFCSRPAMNAVSVLKLEGFLLGWEISAVLLRAAAMAIAFRAGAGATGAVAAFGGVGIVMSLLLMTVVHYNAFRTTPSTTD